MFGQFWPAQDRTGGVGLEKQGNGSKSGSNGPRPSTRSRAIALRPWRTLRTRSGESGSQADSLDRRARRTRTPRKRSYSCHAESNNRMSPSALFAPLVLVGPQALAKYHPFSEDLLIPRIFLPHRRFNVIQSGIPHLPGQPPRNPLGRSSHQTSTGRLHAPFLAPSNRAPWQTARGPGPLHQNPGPLS